MIRIIGLSVDEYEAIGKSRSINKTHETVIIAIGVDEIIHPEEE